MTSQRPSLAIRATPRWPGSKRSVGLTKGSALRPRSSFLRNLSPRHRDRFRPYRRLWLVFMRMPMSAQHLCLSLTGVTPLALKAAFPDTSCCCYSHTSFCEILQSRSSQVPARRWRSERLVRRWSSVSACTSGAALRLAGTHANSAAESPTFAACIMSFYISRNSSNSWKQRGLCAVARQSPGLLQEL
jgi:hypothetical protein